MRIVHRQEEARMLVQMRSGWTFSTVRTKKPKIDWSQFETALF